MKCPFFGKCGGCSSNDSIQNQLIKKRILLKDVFGREVLLHQAPCQWRYRSRMDFVCEQGKLGLRASGRREVVDISHCLLISEAANEVLSVLRAYLMPFWRYVTIREASGIMVVFTTKTPSDQAREDFVSFLKSLACESVYWFIDDSLGDDVGKGKLELRLGKESLTESLCGLPFGVTPFSFFQSNKAVAEVIFEKIRSLVSGRTLDLFCGVGVIASIVADRADGVVGVDALKENIALAKGDDGLSFECESAQDFLKYTLVNNDSFETVIVDPPRTGLGVRVCQSLAQLAPKRIIYVSCNPRSLRNDLALIGGFRLISLEAYDMFPNTDHVECLAVLER